MKVKSFYKVLFAVLSMLALTMGQTAKAMTGTGTQADPYVIADVNDWNTFAANVNAGTDADKYYKMADGFVDSTPVTVMVGTDTNPFTGHFNGNGKTLYVNISGTEQAAAPFSYINGATIEMLTVAGTVTSTAYHAAGLVGMCKTDNANTIQYCTVEANVVGSGYAGGIIGHGGSGNLTMSNCVYSGTISNFTKYAGGLLGWCDSATVTMTDCLFKGSFSPGSGGKYHPIACRYDGANPSPTATCIRVYYTGNDATAGSSYCISGANGLKVTTSTPSNTMYLIANAADGNSYFSATSVSGVQSFYELTGSVIHPVPTVKLSDGTTVSSSCYTVTYSGDETTPGSYSVSISGVSSEGYEGTTTINYDVNYLKPTNLAVSLTCVDPTKATVSWTENGTATQWKICLNGDEANAITVNTNPYTLTGLEAEHGYNVKVCAIRELGDSPWSDAVSFVPTEKVTVGMGTATSIYVPTNCYYNYSLTQQIYTPDELEASVNAGKSIKSIAFYCALTPERNLDIYIVHTDKSSFSSNTDWIVPTADDKVFSGTVNFPSNDWKAIELDTPFEYNGTSNIAIIIDDNTGSYTSTTNFLAYSVSGNQALYKYNDGTNFDPMAMTASGNLTTQKNQLRIVFEETETYKRPSGLTATLTPGNGTIATLDWTERGTATKWALQYGTDEAFTDGTYTEATVTGTPTKSLTGLTPETTYYARVKSVYGDGESLWSAVVSFTPTNFYCFTINDDATTNELVPVYGWWADNEIQSQFIIEAADLSVMTYGTIEQLTFYSSNTDISWGTAEFEVYMTEVDNTTFDSATLVDWDSMDKVMDAASLSIDSDGKMVVTLDDPYQYMGGNLLIGFKQTTTGSYVSCSWYGTTVSSAAVGGYGSSISIQNFLPKTTFEYTPGTAPSCIRPTYVTADNITDESVVVTWTSEASAWTLRYREVGASEWQTVNLTTTTYTITGLDAVTEYEVQVRTNCGGGDYSDWTTVKTFTTELCSLANQGTIRYELTDSYGDGWNGSKIQVVHHNSNIVVAEVTLSGGSSGDGTFNLCCGEDYDFVWYSNSSWDSECGYVFYDINDDEIFSGSGALSTFTYTMNCSSCKKPKDLMLTAEPTINSASLVWTRGSDDQTMWDLAYKADGDADFTLIEELTDTTYTLTGLQEDTPYTVKVRANCGGGDVSVWTAELTFRTAEIYPKPTDVTATDVAHTSAVARWTGNTAGKYDLRYRKVSGVASNFENSSMKPWTSLDADGDGYGWEVWTQASSYLDLTNTSVNPGQAYNGTDEMIVSGSYSNVYGVLTPDNYLISPKVQLGGSISFYAKGQDQSDYTEHFGVAVSTAGNTDDADFTTIQEWDTTNEWQFFTVDLSAYAGQEGYVAIRHFDCTNMFILDIDDIVLTEPGEGYAWTTVSDITEDSCYLAGLSMDTAYEVQVRSNYGSGHYSNWTPSTNFSTLDENTKFFLMDGNWDVASKWTPAGVPVAGNTVHIRAAATVPSGYDMPQMNVIVENGGSILVKDGAQFRSDSSVEITMEKHITGYGDGLANFYLLGSLVYYDNPSADDVENLLDGEYDLYSFDATEDLEWRNYEADAFDMPNAGVGYLYASKDDNTLIFTGQTFATNSYKSTSFAYDGSSTDPFNGWALVSNIFPCNGWLLCTDESSNVVDGNFYKMNAAGGMLEMYQSAIMLAPGEAAFVQLDQAGKVYFFPYEQTYRTPVYVGAVDGCPWLPDHELADHQDADAPTGFLPGDVDMDGDVDRDGDVPAMAQALVGKWPNFNLATFDYNGDGVFSLSDLTELVNDLKGVTLP